VRPLRTIARRSVVKDLAVLREIARSEGIEALVIGMPLTLRGEEAHQAQRVRRFAESAAQLGLPVELYDERHTSTEAALRGASDLDSGAATVLLEDYLAQRAR
jgi:putative transcription antitermination factor YqgF